MLTGPQRAGDLPITVTALGGDQAGAGDHAGGGGGPAPAVRIAVASRRVDRADGASGLVFSVSGSPGRMLVRLDYSSFAKNYGGSWASRLMLVELPPCALTTPGAPGCRRRLRVPGGNDGTHSVWATVQLGSPASGVVPPEIAGTRSLLPSQLEQGAGGPVVLAAVSTPAGEAGNYAATSLNPEGTWSVEQGNFSYDYPIAVPPSLGGSAPDVALSYSSETIDGETSAQNPQGSQIGDGWTYSPGFIEQSYEPCSEDSAATTAEAGDECWDGYNATLSLGGTSGILIGSGPGTWHLQNDDGTKVQLETGGANGMWNGEYWVVTTTDGTKYYFGADHVPGDSSSSLTTNSAWNMPVYCPATTDPCYGSSTGTSSWTQMPYQWNLDYVVDPDNNLTVYEYASESNYYMRGGSTGAGTLTSYIRDGYLTTTLYGWQLANATASPAVYPADKVVFGPSPRCLSSCTTVTQAAYPDVPTDQICASGDTSCENASPTFFSEERLTSIDTYVLESQSSDTYSEVDSYALAQQFDTGTGEATAVMALSSITRTTGEGSGNPLIPATNFDVTMMNNRVLGTTQPALYRPRITDILTSTGSAISIDYNPPECTQGSGGNITNADAPTNTMTCYPAYWAPPSQPNSMDWFNYYTVSQVEESDETGANSVPHVVDYTYPSSGVAWHYDEDPAQSAAYRTWDEYRGYLTVEATTGLAPDPVTENVTWYMRGMNGDSNGSGGTKSVSVEDSLGDAYTDSNYLDGQVLETQTFSAAGGSPEAQTVNGPWTYNSTASMTPPSGSGLSAMSSYMLAQSKTRNMRLLASGSWQTSTSTSYYNSNGQLTAVDAAPAGLTETCATTSYANPPSANPMMLDYADEVQDVSGAYSTASSACPTATSTNLISDDETFYDDESASIATTGTASLGTFGSLASPGGLATGTRQASGWASGSETWQGKTATQYDGYGRVTASYDGDGNRTKTAYTPATGALPTSITKTNPLGWNTVTVMNQDRQLPVSSTDPNGEVTTEAYDALGRVTSVTLPIDSGGDATYEYYYSITGTSPPAVTTETLRENGTYSTDVKIYDGMLQLIEDQDSTANNAAGRLVSYSTYDSNGWPATTTAKQFYDSSASPSTTLFVPNADQIPAQTVTTYDGQGRTISSAFYSLGVYQWQTSVSYPGMNQADVNPPAGGASTEVVTNSLGETAQSIKDYGSSASADPTTYTYDPTGQISSVADANGNTWTYTYNLLGQEYTATDPGTTAASGSTQPGTTTYLYDADGNLSQSTNPVGTVLTYKYDALDRRTAEYNATPGVPNEPVELDSWLYDKTPINGTSTDADGYLTSDTSYDSSGAAYTESITGYNTAYEPTGTSMTIPADQGALRTGTTSNEYTTTTAYTPRTGLAEYTTYSNDGGLPTETVQNTYDIAGLLTQFGDSNDYLDNVNYDPLGEVLSTTFGAYGTQMVQDYTYDAGTARLLQSITNLQTASSAADTTSYTYDDSGNITSESDAQNTGGTQTQCFTYNGLDQLTAAWTDTGGTQTAAAPSVSGIGGCSNTTPSAANIGGPAPYWETYTYDLLGDRTSETTYNTSLPASQDTPANATTQEVQYPGGNLSSSPSSNAPATAQSQPDTAASIVTTSPSGTSTTTPVYNADGELTSQSVSKTTGSAPPSGLPGLSKITYTPQGQVASDTTSSGTTSYIYDANGNLLIQADPSSTTLYADAGAEQITLTGSTLTGVRLLAAPDGVTVTESSSGTGSYQIANQQGTALEDVQAVSLTVTRRYYDPWGEPVGPSAAWPDNNTFLGQPQDPNSGLVVLGARDYDPATGSFTSLDPVLEAGSPQQMGGYVYAADNPVTDSDPTGKTCSCYTPGQSPPPSSGMMQDEMLSIGPVGGDSGSNPWWVFLGDLYNLKANVHELDFKKDFDVWIFTIEVKIKAETDAGSGDSVMNVTLGGDLKGDADIALPNGRDVDIPINLLPEEDEGTSEMACAECNYSAESRTVTVDGVPYNVSEHFTPNSIEFDVDSSGTIKIGSTEVGDTDVEATITIARNPNPPDPLPEGWSPVVNPVESQAGNPLPAIGHFFTHVGRAFVYGLNRELSYMNGGSNNNGGTRPVFPAPGPLSGLLGLFSF
jgi:RHS repeat-associated protein